jgi:DNA-binding CsgD family transcriptional regulator/tetratricopeptide (TPR) repeat protein
MLLEREGLLESLGERLRDAKEGKGSLVLVAGEAGAGKTSLVRAFVESLDGSTLVIQGACDPLSTPRPLSPLHDFAADPNSGLIGLTSEERSAIEMFGEVLDRLRNTIRPILVVIEDIHWADEGTLDFLRFIGRRIEDGKAVMVCTYRDDEVGPDHPLRPVLGQLVPLGSTHRVVVPPLSLAAVTKLASDHAFDPRELLQLTDGNAFFVTEIIASGEGLPHSVQEAVLSRVSRLDEKARRIVDAVSVAPRALEMAHAVTIADGGLDDIDAALSAGILLADGHRLRFRHELSRSAVEGALPPARRLGLHRTMLHILEEEGSVDLALQAHHAIHTDEADLSIQYAPAAARNASSRGAHKEAARFFEAALDHSDRIPDDDTAAMRVELANELGIVDRRPEALDQIDRAVEHYRSAGDELSLARTLIPDTGARWRFEDAARFRRGISEALGILERNEPSGDLARAYLTSAYQHMLARKGMPASVELAKARAAAAEAGTTDLTWMITMLEGTVALVLGDTDTGSRILQDVSREAAAKGHRDDETLALMMLGSGSGEVRRYDGAIPALEKGVEHGLAVDQDYLVAYCRSWLARIAFEQGRWDDAVNYAELVDRATAYRKGIAILTGVSALGRVRVRRGDPGGIGLLEEMVELSRSHELQHGWNTICGRAEYHWLTGNPQAGLDELAPAYQRALDTNSEWARGEIGFWMWRSGAIETAPDGAAEPFALQMAGDWEGAANRWSEIGCPYETALALADGPVKAKLESLAIFDSLGASPMGDRLRKVLRDLGVGGVPRGPTKETLANPRGLTNRQLEVLRLIVDGLDNTEIARELYVSKKTVEHHVSAIYSKLGVDSRTKAVNAALAVGVVVR